LSIGIIDSTQFVFGVETMGNAGLASRARTTKGIPWLSKTASEEKAMFKTVLIAASLMGLAVSLSAQTDTFKVNYFSSANCGPYVPDGTVRITNVGDQIGVAGNTSGDIGAVIYVFDPNQELAECCGCKVTPDGLLTLSINNDLTSNPLTGERLTTGDIKIVSASLSSTPSKVTPLTGIRAWATHIQNAGITETPFTDSTLSAGELKMLESKCTAIFNNGSGFGICSCGAPEAGVSGGGKTAFFQ
jgi:hypothetical protein